MYSVSDNNIITLTRGDTFECIIELDNSIIELEDKVYFGLMEPNQLWEDAILKKSCELIDKESHYECYLKLDSKDTQYLLPGKYYYMLKLQHLKDNEEIVNTLLSKTIFWIE